MAISGTVQSLTAAFSFGILLQAASGALLVYWKGHGSTIFQDGRRLVLVLFLLFAALWAQIDFLNLLISPTASTTCQVGLIFSTTFDQLARVVLEQFLLWSIGNGTKLTAARAILQVVLGVRVVAGGVLAGFTRPQFAPSCVAHTSLLPVSIVVLALDGIIIGALLIQALSLGMFRDARGGQSSDRKDQSKAVIFTILGFAFWTGMSVTMILGLPSIELILRTTLPANGLLVLVGIVLIFQGALVSPRADESLTPEAHSPFMQQPLPPSREVLRDDVNIDGSPIAGRGYTKSGLFVVNPSATPTDSPKNKFDFQGNQTKGSNLRVRELEIPEQGMSRNGPGYRGSSGVFPSMVSAPLGGSFGGMSQGAYAPQIRPSAVAPPTIPAPTADQKKSLFNRSKSPKSNIRSLGISQPIPTDAEGFSGPRMETVDLATAVASERERRDAASARTRLIADRPAPKPPTQTSQEGLRKSVSVKRKVTPAARVPLSPVPSGDSSSVGTSLVANGSSTSASLSPNRDEVRRRSPRSQDTGFGEKVMPKPTLQMKQTIGLPGNPRARMTMPKQADIGQPQTVMFMKDIVYDNPSIVKTIISGAPDMYAKRPKTAGSESILSANFDFGELKSGNALQSSGSIIHRPRPYKRGNSKDRISFFGEASPRHHRRSKSQGSIVNRKSTLYSSSGSPTKLPPLPQHPPTSAASLPRILPGRVLPNDTKSMTFDEKVELLFPAPPGASLGNKRRSSVPSLPRVPSTFLAEVPTQIPTEEEQQNQRASKRTTISFGNQTPRQLSQISPPAGAKNNDPPTFRYSANTYAQLADDDLEDNDDVWQSGIPSQMPSLRTSVRDSVDNNPRRSSAVFHDMRRSVLSEATSSDIESHGGETTNWGSVHSPAPAVEVSKGRARSTFIQNNARAPPEPVPELPQEELDDGEEYIHIGIESEENRKSFLSMSDNNRRSFFLDAGQSLSGEFTSEPENGGTWHRRIGDELPTFSERATKTRSRKMPPPTPLLLKTNGRQASVVVRQAEPSPEQSDAEAKALQEIQAQLKRFEQEPSRGSVSSLLQRIPNASQDDESPHDAGGRFRLLENLEKEMGQQENQWQQMQSNFDRDSMSVVMTPSAPSEEALSRKSSQSSSRPPSRGVSRRARIRSNITVLSKGEESASTQSSDNSRASVWQQRLAEAQLEYMENAPALLRKKSLNFLAVNKTDIGSPTPPDSENSEDEVDQQVESEPQKAHNSPTMEIPSLWQATLSADKTTSGRMWSPPVESFVVRISSPEPPAKNVRPRQRRANEPLPIGSSEMWSKPSSAPHSRSVVALWGSKTVRPISIKTRPVTQRPQRKSKRVTFLPDIIESPQPLPNKRDTLGIFQFPWGERSEHPVYQPAFNPALLAGPAVSNAKLEARSRELESEEYSSSFFDDYEEDESEEEPSEEDFESDDDFDETTLWEIASLLQTDKIPSKNSLLPQPREAIEEYDEETDFEDSEDEAPVQSAMVKFPIEPLRKSLESAPRLSLWEGAPPASSVSPKGLPQPQPEVWQAYMPASDDVLRSKPHTSTDVPELATRELWTAAALATLESTSTDMWTAKSTATIAAPSVVVAEPLPTTWTAKVEVVDDRHSGLFKPDAVRSTYRTTEAEPAASMLVRQPRQATLGLPTIVSQDLWFAGEPEKEEIHWTSIPVVEVDVQKMWTAAIKAPAIDIEGLFTPDSTRTDYRTSNLEPAAISMVSKPRTTVEPMPQLTTRRLWNRRDNVIYERHWISESSVRPDSPSIDSMPSSGRSSPSSETASLRTTSTKASSIWSSISGAVGAQAASRIPSFFETKAKSPKDEAPREPSPLKDDASMSQSKLPIRQIEPKEIKESKKLAKEPSKPLAPIRESRVFAARDLWEAKAPVLESTPVKKFWKRQAKAPQGPAKPTHRAIRHQYRPIVVYRANWEEALQEAIRAGTHKPTLVRRAATSAEWDNALAKAISQGKPRVERPQASREMWALALSEAISKSSTSLANSYNSAVLHPVFFTNSLIANSADIHPAAIGHVSLPRIQRPTASGLDWDMALAKAVSQSTPRVPRPTASPDMWSAALTEAISKSTVSASIKTLGYDPAVLHPVFFTDFLVSDISDIHPAAIGHAVNSADVAALFYDPAVLHPVFFTESMVSSTSDMHPAAIGHAVMRPQLTPPKETQMWSNTSSTFSSTPGSPKDMPMWMKDEIFLQNRLSMFQHMEMESRRNKASVRNLELPTLDSKSLFESRKHVEAAPYNWLEESKAPSTQTSSASTPRMSLNRISTWIPTRRASVNCAPGVLATVDMFTNVQSEHVKRVAPSRSISLPRLSSTELFKVAPVSGPEVHWITARARSYTWTPTPRPSSISAPGTVATFDMFTNLESEPVKRATASRPVALPRLNSTELFKPAASSPSEVNWIAASSAKVVPRVRSSTWVPTPQALSRSIPGAVATMDMFAEAFTEHVRKASSPRTSALASLESTELFKPITSDKVEVNWMMASTTAPKPQTWVAPIRKQPLATPGALATNEMFANIKSEHVKKAKVARAASLPRLASIDLFKPASPRMSKAGVDWLKVSASKPTLPKSQTWVAPPAKRIAVAPGAIGSFEMFANINEDVKKVSVLRPAALPNLNSTELFQSASKADTNIDWLKRSSTKPAVKESRTWIAPTLAITPENNSLWTNSPIVSPLPADMFADVKGEHIKKASSSRPAALPRLSSTELFQPADNTTSERNWLQASSAVAEPKRLTWQERAVREERTSSSMWEASSSRNSLLESPEMFGDFNAGEWRRSKREPEEQKEIESSNMWRKEEDNEIDEMMNWMEQSTIR